MHKHILAAACLVAMALTAGCATLRSQVNCEQAEAVARVALDAIVARCPAVLGPTTSASPASVITPGAPVEATKVEPPIPHSRT